MKTYISVEFVNLINSSVTSKLDFVYVTPESWGQCYKTFTAVSYEFL